MACVYKTRGNLHLIANVQKRNLMNLLAWFPRKELMLIHHYRERQIKTILFPLRNQTSDFQFPCTKVCFLNGTDFFTLFNIV